MSGSGRNAAGNRVMIELRHLLYCSLAIERMRRRFYKKSAADLTITNLIKADVVLQYPLWRVEALVNCHKLQWFISHQIIQQSMSANNFENLHR